MKLLAIILAWAALFFVVPPAHATTTEQALAALCPGHEELAPLVDIAARRHLQHPVHIIAVMATESNCRMNVVGAHGEICAMQIMPNGPAANGLTRKQLRDPATCIATGARWLALRQVDCGGLFLGFGGYNARKCGNGKGYARKVMGMIAKAWKVIGGER